MRQDLRREISPAGSMSPGELVTTCRAGTDDAKPLMRASIIDLLRSQRAAEQEDSGPSHRMTHFTSSAARDRRAAPRCSAPRGSSQARLDRGAARRPDGAAVEEEADGTTASSAETPSRLAPRPAGRTATD